MPETINPNPAVIAARSFLTCAPATAKGLAECQAKMQGAACYALACDARPAAEIFGTAEWAIFRIRMEADSANEEAIRARLDALAVEIGKGGSSHA